MRGFYIWQLGRQGAQHVCSWNVREEFSAGEVNICIECCWENWVRRGQRRGHWNRHRGDRLGCGPGCCKAVKGAEIPKERVDGPVGGEEIEPVQTALWGFLWRVAVMGAGSSRQLWGSGCSAWFSEVTKTLRHVLWLTWRIKKRLKVQEGELVTVGAKPLRRWEGGRSNPQARTVLWEAVLESRRKEVWSILKVLDMRVFWREGKYSSFHWREVKFMDPLAEFGDTHTHTHTHTHPLYRRAQCLGHTAGA